MHRINLSETQIEQGAIDAVPVEVARMYNILPINLMNHIEPGKTEKTLEIAVADNISTGEWADQFQGEIDHVLSGRKVVPAYVATPKDIESAIKQYYK